MLLNHSKMQFFGHVLSKDGLELNPGTQYDVLSIRLSSCSSSPCTMPRGTNVTVNAEFTSNGSPTTPSLKHEAYYILNAIKTKATITPTTCEGVACPLQGDLGLRFSASIYVNPSLPALRGKLRWELTNDSKEVVLCYQIPISIS
ncbi:NPC intracellular cholesterol transporter 2 isoform X2 [Aedes albopictus]|uniref:MD-2-related lipid-recognition domain-containing protein n=1 Tax=Aedes albopictus TaxID=7160 RepID=A0ABM2A7T1_AEDAL